MVLQEETISPSLFLLIHLFLVLLIASIIVSVGSPILDCLKSRTFSMNQQKYFHIYRTVKAMSNQRLSSSSFL